MDESSNDAKPDDAGTQPVNSTSEDTTKSAPASVKKPNATLTQQLAVLADKQAQVQIKIRKLTTRGIILVGAALIRAAARDKYLRDFLRKLVATAEPRNREALELVTASVLGAGE